jgi:hypothetical protein
MKSDRIKRRIDELITTYNNVIKVVDKEASLEKDGAYGGVVRSVKGKLQEYITEEIINIAWESIGGKNERVSIDSKKHKIPIQKDYITHMADNEVKQYIISNISDYYFGLSVDKQIYIDKKLVIGIECKAYTENAMIKRILVDFSLLKTVFSNISCYLFQLESQLGGDYSELKGIAFGSKSTHTLMSYFPKIKLNIFTFLQGERKVNKPIHKKGYFKPLEKTQIEKAIRLLSNDLKKYL